MKSLTKLAAAVALMAIPVFSQGEYLTKGKSGGGLALRFGASESEDARISLAPGFSYKGFLDFRAIISKAYSDFEIIDNSSGGNSLGAGIAWFFIKEDDKSPLSFSTKGTYLYGKPAAGDYYPYDPQYNYAIHRFTRTVEIELAGSNHWQVSEGYSLVPEIGISFHSNTRLGRYNNPPVNADPDWEETRRSLNLGFKLGFQKELGKNASFIWTAEANLGIWGIGTDQYDEGLGLNAGGFAAALLFYK